MSEAVKFGLFIATGGILFWLVNQSQKVNYNIQGYGTPSLDFKTWQLALPVKVKFTNPTPAPIAIDEIQGTVTLFKNNKYEPVGRIIPQPLVIQPGTNTVSIITVLELKKFFEGGNLISNALNIAQARQLRLRTDLKARYATIELPVQTFEKIINV